MTMISIYVHSISRIEVECDMDIGDKYDQYVMESFQEELKEFAKKRIEAAHNEYTKRRAK